ncbi:MAG: serine/threonine protein phosphatase [Clostridiales bacterium]|nr:serine/threonine protein phosphatase [Clostridiales bacterium]
MNDICIDIDYQQLYKHGQQIGGDVFLLDREPGSNIITATLSDGLGSGVKANVLASLTSHMANKLSFSPIDLNHSAEIIMDTLPIDKEKGISYATFTIAKVIFSNDKSFIDVDLIEYDNPVSLRFSGSDPVDWDKTATRLHRKSAIKKEIVYSSSFSMRCDDRLIFFSDGVAQAGISLGKMPLRDEPKVYGGKLPSAREAVLASMNKGWGEENVREFVQNVLKRNPDISSRDLTREIVTEAYKRDNYKANDDITCVAVHVRKPRRTLIVTGAPRNRESDKKLKSIIENYRGNVIVCGGTTAKIVARELGKAVKADRSPSGSLPPASIIEGIDLVTEGMLTLSAVSDRLTRKVLLKNMPEDPARRFIKILRNTDQVEFVVGTKINDETDDPTLAAKIGVRFPLIEQMATALRNNYLKEVEISYL